MGQTPSQVYISQDLGGTTAIIATSICVSCLVLCRGRAGETIPASDSDDETRRGEGTLEGAHREREEWVLQRAASELGAGPMVVDVLASRLGAASSARLPTNTNSQHIHGLHCHQSQRLTPRELANTWVVLRLHARYMLQARLWVVLVGRPCSALGLARRGGGAAARLP